VGKTFVGLIYINITKNTYPQLSGYGDTDSRKLVFFRFHILYLFSVMHYLYTA